jgi:hypothetical protein
VNDAPPEGTGDVTEWLWRRRNTRIHWGISWTGTLVGVIGSAIPLWLAVGTGLYISPSVYPLWRGTFDYLNVLFIAFCATSLVQFGVRDEHHYAFRLWSRFRRSKRSDLVIPVAFLATAILWGELLLRPILTGRATDPTYLQRQPPGTASYLLEAGVPVVLTAYYLILAAVVVIYLIGLRYNPVDLDEYDHMSRRILGTKRTRK